MANTTLFPDETSEEKREETSALSVSAAMNLAKQALEGVVVRIIGEVSEVSVKPGYKAAYFTIKDSSASLPCMMWNNRYKAAGIDLAVGQLIEITGRFSLYAAKGRMNFDVFSIALAGEGDLRMKVANIARKLAAEGLTDPARKLPLPEFPERIGLVTSPRSAAVHDVLRTLRRRFPEATILLAGVPVEGAQAAQGIIEGMRCVYRAKPDVMLIVRGGGSFEDLMPFNDEALARAIAACPIPVVTGIGHEVDTTIADMVSDLRASTPTAAAEAVSPSRESLEALLDSKRTTLQASTQRHIERLQARLDVCAARPVFSDPHLLYASEALWIDTVSDRLTRALPLQMRQLSDALLASENRLSRALPANVQRASDAAVSSRARLTRIGATVTDRFAFEMRQAASRLADLSPVNTLARGYSITRNEQGDIVRRVQEAPAGTSIAVTVSNGVLNCSVLDTEEQAPVPALDS